MIRVCDGEQVVKKDVFAEMPVPIGKPKMRRAEDAQEESENELAESRLEGVDKQMYWIFFNDLMTLKIMFDNWV